MVEMRDEGLKDEGWGGVCREVLFVSLNLTWKDVNTQK